MWSRFPSLPIQTPGITTTNPRYFIMRVSCPQNSTQCRNVCIVDAAVGLSTLLLDNGLPDQPILLIEPHRTRVGVWRIKFCYDDVEPLSMNAEQASKLAVRLHQMGQDELACEIDEAVGRAKHYDAM